MSNIDIKKLMMQHKFIMNFSILIHFLFLYKGYPSVSIAVIILHYDYSL